MGASTDAQLLARALRNPGRLVLGPTTISGSFPFGGTSLGFARRWRLGVDVLYSINRDPTSGAIIEISRKRVEVPTLMCLIDGPGWDEDILAATFAKYTLAASLANPVPAETRVEGTLIPYRVQPWNKLLFVSNDSAGKCVLFRRPLPLLDPSEMIDFGLRSKACMGLKFVPTPDSSNSNPPYWQVSRRENLTLGSP